MELDEDVMEEEKRVEQYMGLKNKYLPNQEKPDSHNGQMQVVVNKFRKVYRTGFSSHMLAVEKTSFGLDFGECFALLGVNGAGKTTTFKSLTNEIIPTSGDISIGGHDAKTQFGKIRKIIGYCPQHDCIFDLMTVEEHLDYYARIKGIVREKRLALVEKAIKDLNLESHRKKQAGSLSGGNKRKLSVALSVLGNPPIILLDEPSAGMDPEARRFMWSVVAKISQ
jgi:ABC-type multidrug transport system ATPase subunit